MLLKILSYLYIIFALLFILSVGVNKFYFSKLKDNIKSSNFVAYIGFFLAFYILLNLAILFFIPDIVYKVIMLFFAISPFIIGRLATYQKEKIYSTIQVFCVLISVVFVIYIGVM